MELCIVQGQQQQTINKQVLEARAAVHDGKEPQSEPTKPQPQQEKRARRR